MKVPADITGSPKGDDTDAERARVVHLDANALWVRPHVVLVYTSCQVVLPLHSKPRHQLMKCSVPYSALRSSSSLLEKIGNSLVGPIIEICSPHLISRMWHTSF